MVETFDISNLDYFISNTIYSLKYLWPTTLGCKDIGIRKSDKFVITEFFPKTRFTVPKAKLGQN